TVAARFGAGCVFTALTFASLPPDKTRYKIAPQSTSVSTNSGMVNFFFIGSVPDNETPPLAVGALIARPVYCPYAPQDVLPAFPHFKRVSGIRLPHRKLRVIKRGVAFVNIE